MATFDVTLKDSRVVRVKADDKSGAMKHADAVEVDRLTSERNKLQGIKPVPHSAAVSAVKVKD